MKWTHFDLCSGIGGFSVAAEWAGFETIAFAEIDPYCCKVLAKHWPGVKNYGDIRRTDCFSELRGNVVVASGGIPCQPSSTAGRRRGAADDRWLWDATIALVRHVEPDWLVFENPDGIVSMGEFPGILFRLESLGYGIRLFRVSANSAGARHWRYRVFIVGCRNIVADRPGLFGNPLKRCQSDGTGELLDGAIGTAEEVMADADPGRLQDAQHETQPVRFVIDPESATASDAVSDAQRAGLRSWSAQAEPDAPEQPDRRGRRTRTGSAFAEFCRIFDGLCYWLDPDTMPPPLVRGKIADRPSRLRCLGNAVVPQQCCMFFEMIRQTEEKFRGLVPMPSLIGRALELRHALERTP